MKELKTLMQGMEVLFKEYGNSLLADLLACRARVDKTEPDPGNSWVGWRTDQLLQDIDAFMVGQKNAPAVFAQIVQKALDQLQVGERTVPTTEALLRLAIFRGERLLPVSAERKEVLGQMQERLADLIQGLPEGTRKTRCCSLFEYHQGVFYDAYGLFSLAADAQSRAADQADQMGDAPGAAVCRYSVAFNTLKQALVDGKPDKDVIFAFKELERNYCRLVTAIRGTVLEAPWGQGNGPMHLLHACVWLEKMNHPDWDSWVATALAAAEKLGQAWKSGADLVRALDLVKRNDAAANAALIDVAQSGEVNEYRATALLVMARRSLTKGEQAGTKYAAELAVVELIKRMPEPGAQHVRAIAGRLL